MWKAVVIYRGGTMLPTLGEYPGWKETLARCTEYVGTITPGRYRLEEVGVDLVGDAALVFAVLKGAHNLPSGWILNALGPKEELPTLEEVMAALEAWGFARDRWVWLHSKPPLPG